MRVSRRRSRLKKLGNIDPASLARAGVGEARLVHVRGLSGRLKSA
jgi:hypothetical protein